MQFCYRCLGEVEQFTKKVDKDGLISLLTTKMNMLNTGISVSDFTKLLKSNMDLIFHKDDKPRNKHMGQIHRIA
jgi:hypothetical protein